MKDSSSSSSAPLLGLRMKASSSSAPQLQVEMDHDVMLDMLAAMTAREQTYKCGDYLTRHRQQTRRPPLLGSCSYTCSKKSSEALSCADTASSSSSSSSFTSSTCSSSHDQEQQQQEAAVVDATCREKMCEWSYRVCDHFHTPREIVAFSMSFLDRFVDRRYSSDCRDGATTTSVSASCCCDRTTFKLASMTTLYLATKVFNGKQISIGTLAELSRGEFDVAHIAEMERSILETLDFRLSPPTIQAFIGLFIQLIPASDDVSDDDKFTTAREIYQRAIFFAELCAYDYSLILHDRSLVAVAAILNAIEGGDGMEDPIMAEDMRVNFLESVNRLDVPLHIDEDDLEEQLESTQARLWYVYSCSAQEQAGRGIPCGLSSSSHTKRMIARHHHHHHHEDSTTCNNKRRASHHHSHSPVSVITATTTAT
jgi:Cyclin, N-terminal domain/Cyclin, C-terminal domain